MPWSGGKFIRYSEPRPFATPARFDDVSSLGFVKNQRETLEYSAQIIEEIMYQVNQEYKTRQKSLPIWKKYKSSVSDYSTFKPNPDGSNLKNIPLFWMGQYIIDIQAAIDGLITDVKIPDTRRAYLARVFCNNTTAVGAHRFNNNNKLIDNVPTSNGTIDLLSRAQAGNWIFTDNELKQWNSFVGINASGVLIANPGNKGINSAIEDWPRSPISNKSGTDVGGIKGPMTSANRPHFSRKNIDNIDGIGIGLVDRDIGHGYLGHLALAIQQLRYQPPIIEWWPNPVTVRHYVSNIYSQTTPNKPWYFGQPVETFWPQNWGFWMMGGYCGVASNEAVLRIYNDPMVEIGRQPNCPFQAFYPRPKITCSCGYYTKAFLLWVSREVYGFIFDNLPFLQMGADIASRKYFGPNTVLKIQTTVEGGEGGGSLTRYKFRVGINTTRLGIIATPSTFVVDHDMESGPPGTISIKLMEKLNEIYPWYPIRGTDAIDIMYIVLEASVNDQWDCITVWDGHISYVPKSCFEDRCSMPDTTVRIGYISLDEDSIAGDPVTDYPD